MKEQPEITEELKKKTKQQTMKMLGEIDDPEAELTNFMGE